MNFHLNKTVCGLPLAGILNLLIIYFFWSATFLFIKISLMGPNGIPPFLLGTVRMLIAGLALIALGIANNFCLRATRNDMRAIGLLSLLIWGGAAALLTWGIRFIPSGLAAIITACIPAFAVLIDSVLKKRRLEGRLLMCIATGFIGLFIMVGHDLFDQTQSHVVAIAAVIISAILCAVGFCYQKRYKTEVKPIVFSAYQLILSGCLFGALSILNNESLPNLNVQQLMSWTALTVITGVGVIAFTYTLRLLPINIAMTYAYVNPVIALFLGWVILDERMTAVAIVGAAGIILSVLGIFSFNKETGGEIKK